MRTTNLPVGGNAVEFLAHSDVGGGVLDTTRLSLSVAQTSLGIVTLNAQVAALQGNQATGFLGFTTLALLNADLNHPANTVAFVSADGSNNGTYLKSGGIGAGAWTRTSTNLPYGAGGSLSLGAGSVGAPSLYFSTDTTSGFWRSAANVLNASIAGVLALTLGGSAASPAFGKGALAAITSGFNDAAFGDLALNALTSGASNVAVGHSAGALLTTGTGNVGVGAGAMGSGVVTGTYNVGIGFGPLAALTAGNYNIAIGFEAMQALTAAGGEGQIAIGAGSLLALTTGIRNTAIGHGAGAAITDGGQNVLIGNGVLPNSLHAGLCVAIGQDVFSAYADGDTVFHLNSVGIGFGVMASLTTGYENVGVGTSVMTSATTAYWNVGVGIQAMQAVTTGFSNTGIGLAVLGSLTSGSKCVGIGQGAGAANGANANTSGSNNTYLGAFTCGGSATQRDHATIIGADAIGVLFDNSITLGRVSGGTIDTTYSGAIVSTGLHTLPAGTLGAPAINFGSAATGFYATGANTISAATNGVRSFHLSGTNNNFAAGVGALGALTTGGGTQNIALGNFAMGFRNVSGSYNVALGFEAGVLMTGTSYHVAIGGNALAAISNSTSVHIAIGFLALGALTDAALYNIAIGHGAGNSLTDGGDNVLIGYGTMPIAQHGSNVIAIGKDVFSAYADGGLYNLNSVGIGFGVMASLTTGYENVGVGTSVMTSATSAYWNVGVGIQALQVITTGYSNTGIGLSCLAAMTTGFQCVGIGHGAGCGGGNALFVNVSGSNNTYLGFEAGPSSAAQFNFATVVGSSALGVLFSNAITLGRIGTDVVYAGETVLGNNATPRTVSTLPAASAALKGARSFVSDATSPTFLGALTGGGAVICPVFCNGSAWVAG